MRLTAPLAVALCLGLPHAGLAQGEIFIPGADDAPEVQPAPQPANRLAGCLLNPNAGTCGGVTVDPDGLALESAVPGGPDVQFETLVLDLDTKKVSIAKTPPPAPPQYDDPQPARHGTVAYPSVAVTIEFDYNSDRVRHDQRGKIDQLVAALSDPALAGTSYAVIGHTDAVGSDAYNCDLSVRRAASVTRMLQTSYVTLPLYPVGFGEHVLKPGYDPRAPQHRRVTFLRMPDSPGAVQQTVSALCP